MTRLPAWALLLVLPIACAEPVTCPHADLAPLAQRPAYVFVASDYGSSAIGLLDADGALLREAWLDSGTVPPGLVTPLSGDVVLASGSLAPCVVAVIDRFGADVVTFLDVCASQPLLGQMVVGSGRSNPRDVVLLDGDRALVSRFSSAAAPDAPPLERGNDLLLIDWRARRVLSRVDLSRHDTHEPEHALARPDRMVRLERDGAGVVIVGLARLSTDYMVAGPGAVAVVNAAELTHHALALPGLSNCGEVDAVPGRPELAVVTCAGRAFASVEERAREAGLALLELAEGEVRVRGAWYAGQHEGSALLSAWSIPLSAERVVSIAMGDFSAGLDDRAYVVDPQRGSVPTRMAEARDAFVLGDGAFDSEAGLLLVPDAERGGIRRFSVDARGIAERELVFTAPCRGLPPREVRRLERP